MDGDREAVEGSEAVVDGDDEGGEGAGEAAAEEVVGLDVR